MSSMDDDSSDDDDSDSSSSSYSSSYETESESLNSDRSDSVHSENSDEAAWQVEDVGESTHRVFTGHVGRRRHRHSAEVMCPFLIEIN